MCGRFSLIAHSLETVALHFGLTQGFCFGSRYNIAPGEQVPIIKVMGEVEFSRWGFVPAYKMNQAKELGFINIRSETVNEKVSFKKVFQKQRCLVMASGFYEWKTIHRTKQPFYVQRSDQPLFALGGIWEGSTFGILTTQANSLLRPIHDRMPVMISIEEYAAWLDPKTPVEKLSKLLNATPKEGWAVYPVTPKMNYSKFESSLCIESL